MQPCETSKEFGEHQSACVDVTVLTVSQYILDRRYVFISYHTTLTDRSRCTMLLYACPHRPANAWQHFACSQSYAVHAVNGTLRPEEHVMTCLLPCQSGRILAIVQLQDL